MYGPAIVKQILEGRHVRRAIETHVVTTQLCGSLASTCTHVDVIKSLDVIEKMTQFDSQVSQKPLFIVMRQYMQMVMDMLQFIRSVRTGDWNLHLLSTKTFVKYYFAHSKLNYARMIPVYLADMEALKQSDAEIYGEFLSGNWVVNKNQHVPFFAVGADHALEQINRSMEVSAGLVGITLNPSARTVMSCSTWSPRQSCLSTDMCRQSKLGQQLFDDFVTSRIITNTTDLWASMKKCQLQTWKAAGEKVKLSLGQKVMELKEDRSLSVRLLMVSKSRPEINLEDAVGRHELSFVLRSMFAADGEMLHCHTKSNLMAILESLPDSTDNNAI